MCGDQPYKWTSNWHDDVCISLTLSLSISSCVCKCVEDEDHFAFSMRFMKFTGKNHAIVSNKWPNKSLSRYTNEFAGFHCVPTDQPIHVLIFFFFWRLAIFSHSNLSTSNLHAIHYVRIYGLHESSNVKRKQKLAVKWQDEKNLNGSHFYSCFGGEGIVPSFCLFQCVPLCASFSTPHHTAS